MEEFKEYNIEVAAIEYGFMIATNVIALLGIKEIEAAEEYFRLIEAYVIKKKNWKILIKNKNLSEKYIITLIYFYFVCKICKNILQ